MNVIFSYTLELDEEERYLRRFKFTLHAEVEGFRTIHYEAIHPSRIEACRQALELFAMRATPKEAMVSYEDKIHEHERFYVGPTRFIVEHLPDDEIKGTILQIIEIWKKEKSHDKLLAKPGATPYSKLLR